MSRLETEFADADDSPGLMLWRVTNAWQAAQRAALKPYDLTHVQFVLLASLTWLGGAGTGEPVTQRHLAQHAGTDPMMTSQVLRTLEAKGLVTREAHPTDARARALAATSTGVELVNRAIGAVERVDRDFFAALGRRRGDFTKLLSRLV
ncbi:MAG TPA: MarR family winged helix-turn-helix transcriptional regulator [Kribbellaceae bacterium]|nr:MarR family winged helix-turn-helix transcriptional regulator [Kribbellaceae bacterium]